MIITTFMAANVLARHWQRARTQYWDDGYSLGKKPVKLDPPIAPDIEELRLETLAFLEKYAFTHLDFATESGGGCDTCFYEYPALVFYGGKNRRRTIIDISMDDGLTLPDVYAWLAEGERLEAMR